MENFPFDHFFKLDKKEHGSDLLKLREFSDLNPASGINYPENKPMFTQKDSETSFAENNEQLMVKISDKLRETINSNKFNAFFKDTLFLSSIDENSITFSTTTSFIKKMIENHYMNQLLDATEIVLGKGKKIIIKINEGLKRSFSSNEQNILNTITTVSRQETQKTIPQLKDAKKISNAKEARFSIDLIPSNKDLLSEVDSKVLSHLNEAPITGLFDRKKNFDSFIVGPSNNMAYAAATAIGKNPGKEYSLYIYSYSGLGKTHILHAVGNYIRDNHPTLRICLITARDFMNEMIDSITTKKTYEFRKKYSEQVDVLMVDDIHELKNKPSTQNEFFHVFNELHQKGKQLIFTSDKPPKEIDGLEERLKTRLSWGLVVDIQAPDFETRLAILKKKALESDIFIPDDVIKLIASSEIISIRELEGSLIRLVAYSSLFGVDIDLEVARQQLKLASHSGQQKNSIEFVGQTTAGFYKIPLVDLKSKSRLKEITYARHVAMYLCYTELGLTLMEIGSFFSNRDHTSVLHGIEKIKKQLSFDTNLENEINDLKRLLTT